MNDDDVFYAWMFAAAMIVLSTWAYLAEMMPAPYGEAVLYFGIIGMIGAWDWCRRAKRKDLKRLLESEDMQLTICDGCGKPINEDGQYLKTEWTSERAMVMSGGIDYSDKQFHDWDCMVVGAEKMHVQDTRFFKKSTVAHLTDDEIIAGIRGKKVGG